MKKLKFVILLLILLSLGITSSNFAYLADEDSDLLVNKQFVDSMLINDEIKNINSEIQSQKNRMQSLKNKQTAYSKAIQQKQSEKSTLNNQLAILDNRIAKSELDIESVELDINRVNLEIKRTNLAIGNKNEEIDGEKIQIEDILRLMYKEGRADTLEILLLNNSLANFLTQAQYLEDVNSELKNSIRQLGKLKEDLEKEIVILEEKNKKLDDLKIEIISKKEALVSEQNSKKNLIIQVNSSEKEYQRLLAVAKAEQDEASSEIASLEKVVRAKYAQLEGDKLQFNDKGMIWPVPKNTVTSYFHDPDYPYKHIFEHPAIDIRAGQGTTLKAAASGYIARSKDGGKKGYSYIMIIHGDGLSTVYGHVSKSYVKEDDFVVQGQTIGLTGGLPGTNGAGALTTGPHLHFEVRKNGIPINPLSYLP